MKPSCVFCRAGIEIDKFNSVLDAVTFKSWGQFGSKVFGRLNGSYIEFHVCDSCLLIHKNDVTYYGPYTIRKPEAWRPEGKSETTDQDRNDSRR